uniref:Potassium/proton antiporter CemA n=2 Tax=Ephedra TaxID=3387 RepID=A0A8F4TIZ5_9SPER|nr:putative heme-binding protein [Ephedra pachyclada]YP_010453592.1 putative heme-binding protein [Ephedra somalensis]QXG17895.1 putative heme-binding protein [Ephedra pachyclada]QXG18297.1 putative heme-binding protein [Ephedra somalensis]
MGLIPHSIIRIISRLRSELMNKSSSLVIHHIEVTQNRAAVSLRYVACFIVLPCLISISLEKCVESWVTFWWNTSSSKILDYLQEENNLVRVSQIEELLLFETTVEDFSETHLKKKFLFELYKKDCIQIVTHLGTNLLEFIILSTFLFMSQKKLTIFFSWIREIFYSINDTMKAFSILLMTDLCIGFHSPHGWEVLISWISENYGFVHNDQIIFSLVSTFPVILDTILKYWIFRRFNRISPSLVVIYHSMNE